MTFLDAHGWTTDEFLKRKLGPVVVEDKLTYTKELRLLEAFRVDLALAGITEDGRRMKLRNRFYREADDALAATIQSVVL